MKTNFFLLLLTFTLLSCRKDYGPFDKKASSEKNFFLNMNFQTIDSNRVLLYLYLDSASLNNSILISPTNVKAQLFLRYNNKEIFLQSTRTGRFIIDSAYSIPSNTNIEYELIINQDTIVGNILTSEPILYDSSPVDVDYNLNGISVSNNLKCTFEDYFYLSNSSNYVDGLVIKNKTDLADLFVKHDNCIPFNRYPSDNITNVGFFKYRKEFEDIIKIGFNSQGIISTRPSKNSFNVNKGRVYGYIYAYTASTFQINTPDQSKKVLGLTLLDKNGNNILNSGYKIKEIDIAESVSPMYSFDLKRNLNYHLELNSAYISLFEIGNIFKLCPEQLENYKNIDRKFFIKVSLTTPDNRTIISNSEVFMFNDFQNLELKFNE